MAQFRRTPCKIPRKLEFQAVYKLALTIVRSSINAIDYWFGGGNDETRKKQCIDTLKAVKKYHWISSRNWHSRHEDEWKCPLSQAFLDVLDINKEFSGVGVPHRYVLQVAFSCEAGNMEGRIHIMDGPACMKLSSLLDAIAPFRIKCLHDDGIKFSEPSPLTTLLYRCSTTDTLKRINLYFNLDNSTLESLQSKIKHIEFIKLELQPANYREMEEFEESLTRTFYSMSSKSEIDKCLETEQRPQNSFEKLKELSIHCEGFPQHIREFLTGIQFFYPEVRTKLKYLVKVTYDTLRASEPFVCPTMVLKNGKLSSLEEIRIYFWKDGFGDKNANYASEYPKLYKTIHDLLNPFTHNVRVLQGIVSLYCMDTPRFIYYTDIKVAITTNVETLPFSIKELYVIGTFSKRLHYNSLKSVLTPNLKVLSLFVNPMRFPDLVGLAKIPTLEVLLIRIAGTRYHINDEYIPPNENHSYHLVVGLIELAPNLKVLEVPGLTFLQYLVDMKTFTHIQTLIITGGPLDIARYCCLGLPSSISIIVKRDFTFENYLRLKKEFHLHDTEIYFESVRLINPFGKSGLPFVY